MLAGERWDLHIFLESLYVGDSTCQCLNGRVQLLLHPEFMGNHGAQQPATLTEATPLGSAQGGNLPKNRGEALGLEVLGFLYSDDYP